MVVPKQTLTPTTKLQTIPKQTTKIIKETEDLDLSSHPVRPAVEPTTPQRNVTSEQTQQIDPPSRNRRPQGQNQVQQRNAQSISDGNVQAAAQTLN